MIVLAAASVGSLLKSVVNLVSPEVAIAFIGGFLLFGAVAAALQLTE